MPFSPDTKARMFVRCARICCLHSAEPTLKQRPHCRRGGGRSERRRQWHSGMHGLPHRDQSLRSKAAEGQQVGGLRLRRDRIYELVDSWSTVCTNLFFPLNAHKLGVAAARQRWLNSLRGNAVNALHGCQGADEGDKSGECLSCEHHRKAPCVRKRPKSTRSGRARARLRERNRWRPSERS